MKFNVTFLLSIEVRQLIKIVRLCLTSILGLVRWSYRCVIIHKLIKKFLLIGMLAIVYYLCKVKDILLIISYQYIIHKLIYIMYSIKIKQVSIKIQNVYQSKLLNLYSKTNILIRGKYGI